MVVPYTPLTGASTPFWIAIEEKLFQQYGLEIAPLFISAGSSTIVPAMTAGQFDIGAVGGGAVVLNRFSGGDLITIGAQTGVYTTDCFPNRTLNRFAISKGEPSRYALRDVNSVCRIIDVTFWWSQTNRCGFYSNRGQFGSDRRAFERQSGRGNARLSSERRGAKKGFRQLTDLAKSEDGAFPTTAIAARESWLKDPKNREIALNFLRGFTDGLTLARTDAAMSKKVLRKYTRVEDEADCRRPSIITKSTSVIHSG